MRKNFVTRKIFLHQRKIYLTRLRGFVLTPHFSPDALFTAQLCHLPDEWNRIIARDEHEAMGNFTVPEGNATDRLFLRHWYN
jgi:hypothetical protein